jgi:hypothetical protein
MVEKRDSFHIIKGIVAHAVDIVFEFDEAKGSIGLRWSPIAERPFD